VGLESFEAASAHLYGSLRGRGDAKLRDDLSPMFGVMWGSARVLVERLAERPLQGLRVLELGCGLGLPSMVAASQGAHVTATDQHPDTGLLLAKNAAHNGVTVTYLPLDLRAPRGLPERAFDHVLATDVLFAAEMPPLVAAGFARYLAPDGVGWLADPGRPWAVDFEVHARALGLSVTVDAERVGDDEAFLLELRWADPDAVRAGPAPSAPAPRG
jgi:predicted nicotinamide N-methyase